MAERDDAVIPVSAPGETLWFGEARRPVVVVLHDGYGRLPAVLEYCDSLSAHGFRVAAPDLYGGVATTDEASAERLMTGLALEPALALIDDCVATASGSRVGVLGFAVGGWLALAHAQTGAADAVVAYYATLGPDTAAVLPCPVMLHFAETDEWEDDEDPDAFVARLQDHGTPVMRRDYVGTVHSFANAAIPEAYEPRAAALAFARTTGFLQRELLD
jgi:carboxymethylenebutenolidase